VELRWKQYIHFVRWEGWRGTGSTADKNLKRGVSRVCPEPAKDTALRETWLGPESILQLTPREQSHNQLF
jgi:hypothetical protein